MVVWRTSQELQADAELFTTKAGNFAAVADASRSNGQYMHTPDNSGTDPATNYLAFEVEVTNGGDFYLALLSTGPNGGSDSFWVAADSGANQQVTTGSGGNWLWKQSSSTPNTLSLPTGTHTIYVRVREDGAQVDKLYLSKSSTLPTGLGGTTLTPQYR